MGHELLSSTQAYYQVGEKRRRAAVDRLANHQFDRHGNRVWREAQALLDHEHTRHALGQVSVPYGTCGEPSNVQAGGGACPFRFRCVGCDHFRTDASHLPELKGYLHDLLRDRERVLAGSNLEDWARTVKGHVDLPAGGHETCPVAATRSAHRQPPELRQFVCAHLLNRRRHGGGAGCARSVRATSSSQLGQAPPMSTRRQNKLQSGQRRWPR